MIGLKLKESILPVLAILFLLSGLLFLWDGAKPKDIVQTLRTVEDNLGVVVTHMENAMEGSMPQVASGNFKGFEDSNFNMFLYEDLDLIKWSDKSFVPASSQVDEHFEIKLLQVGQGDFLVRKWDINPTKFIIGVITLRRNYPIENNYLHSSTNELIFPIGDYSILPPTASLGNEVQIKNQTVFKVSTSNTSVRNTNYPIGVILVFASLILVIVFIFRFSSNRLPQFPDIVFVGMVVVMLIIRKGMVGMDFPRAYWPSRLFDPQWFSSSTLNQSLGDLLINQLIVFFLCLYLFRNYYRFFLIRKMLAHKIARGVLSVISAIAVLFGVLYPFVVVQTLYNNSSIVIDITESLQFDSLRIVSFLVLTLGWGSSFLFVHVFSRLLIRHKKSIYDLLFALIGCVCFVLINLYSGQYYQSSLYIGIFFIGVLWSIRLYSSLKKLSYRTFAYLFFTAFCFALNGAYSVAYFNRIEKIENEFRFAENFLIDRDYLGESLLQDVVNQVASDVFIQTRLASPFLGKDAVRQKVRQVFIPNYFNKYDEEIFLFNALGEPLENRMATTFSQLVSQYDKEAYRTDYQGVYFINSPTSDVTQKYLVVVPMRRLDVLTGYVVLELSLKKIIPDSVYPELLVDNRFTQFYRTEDLSYAVYRNQEILFSSGDFNFEKFFEYSWLGDPAIHKTGISKLGYLHIAFEDQSNRVAVVSMPTARLSYILANFSFLMVLGLGIILILVLALGIVNYWRGSKLVFSARIQLFLNLSFFLPLIVVSVTTLSLTTISSKEQLDNEYIDKSRVFGEQITLILDDYLIDNYSLDFESELTDLAKLSSLDANIYLPHGKLLSSSQPLIYENGLLSEYINPEALERIRNGETLFITPERVGTLQYYVSYTVLQSPGTGDVIGILGIPFFQAGHSLEKVQITVLANILNVFSGIFILLLLLSYFVSQWLTYPLKIITQSLSKTSLTQMNQPLTWNADDEIGLMVKEYNQMLFNLGESKAELEQTQREKTWREIAQQVAHEIKNPLTPMKLTLQQLERAIRGETNTPEKTDKAIASLLQQVDSLNEIASSFSSFAKMPEPVIRELELISLLKRVVNLHSHSGSINLTMEMKEVTIRGDDQLLSRIFSNLIINGFQAARPGVTPKVTINVLSGDQHVRLIFKDNGKGIKPEFLESVFTPHFSTKKSGSGLGLAISKQGIEQMNGKIWFESQVGVGTAFFIELPKA